MSRDRSRTTGGAAGWVALGAVLAVGAAASLLTGPLGSGAPIGLVVELRLPRVVLAILAGSSLAVSGCVLQSVLRNDLATPYTLGISAGAGVTAGAIIIGRLAVSALGLVAAGSAGALAAVAAVYLLARAGRGGDLGIRLLLSGVTVNLVGAAVLLLFEYLSPASRLVEIVRWMMGDLGAVGFQKPLFLLPFTSVGLLVVLARTGVLNQLSVGEEIASARGVSVARERGLLLVSAALLAGSSVGVIGPVGFVGLIVPHMMRRLTGSDYRSLVPASALGGAIVLLCADTLSRIVISPAELPIGVVMALVGGPFFLFLLLGDYGRRDRRAG
jgi:iron complex transport system permease protein